ncbi:hypothetical protein BU24DRAFT_43662 [Aaosphaeria arxii CBS 175.79]|uniref:DUF1275 domain protein n=1 Tax=Aaosphaeria arxii CBS 175.79 TaxID=1450172 RepID=A0A6A5YAJ1_9PLEO|nr:uncharacterized protein BU24DRAFT_43662 [Aaosphaeria arxii CBS 175.79]KAF2022369.1 hypothetical protein BU24DRAFT_43662 [Aaosphaeria arxii CBS 175.79]
MFATDSPSSASSATEKTKGWSLRPTDLRKDIDKQWADIPVCLCSFASGLCDSIAFNSSAVFVSMQTGNTIFLAIGAAYLPSHQKFMWLRAICSIGCFLAGVFCFSKLRHIRPIAKGTLALNFLTQAILVFIAAALAQSGVTPEMADLPLAEHNVENQIVNLKILIPIGFLAFSFGGQIVSSRQLGFNEVPTNVLTSVYCDLLSDPNLFAPWSSNLKRNRRAFAVVLTFLGGLSGSWLGWSSAGLCTGLWIAGALKVAIAITWLFWKVEEPKLEEKK